METPGFRRGFARFGRSTAGLGEAIVINQSDDPSLVNVADLAKAFGTDLEHGLSAEDAANRLRTYGPNELRSAPPLPL